METGYKSLRKKPRTRKRTHRKRTPNVRAPTKNELREALVKEVLLKKGATLTDGKLAVEVMDEQIAHFEGLMSTLYPWDADGKQLRGKSVQAYYWAAEMRRDYIQMRAPYQSPRLSAVQIVPAQNRQQVTEVNVTILNEKGDVEYTDAPEDDELKQIEHVPSDDEEAA